MTEKIFVSIYEDEFEAVSKKLKIEEVANRNIREALGLSPVRSKKGFTGKLIDKIRDMSDDDKEKLFAKLEKE